MSFPLHRESIEDRVRRWYRLLQSAGLSVLECRATIDTASDPVLPLHQAVAAALDHIAEIQAEETSPGATWSAFRPVLMDLYRLSDAEVDSLAADYVSLRDTHYPAIRAWIEADAYRPVQAAVSLTRPGSVDFPPLPVLERYELRDLLDAAIAHLD